MEKMTYEKIEAVNQEINGTDIKGKSYAEVPQRVKAFRKLYPCGRIETEIVSLENGVVIFKATIYDEENKVLSEELDQIVTTNTEKLNKLNELSKEIKDSAIEG